MRPGLKSVTRNAINGWNTEVTRDYITRKVARAYHAMKLPKEPDAQPDELLRPPGADDKNNYQNFFRINENFTVPSKATIMDLLPAIITAMPVHRARDMLNQFLNPLGFSVTKIGVCDEESNRDQLLYDHSKETSEAFQAVIALRENASLDQLREAHREVQEGLDSHKPLLKYLESLMVKKNTA